MATEIGTAYIKIMPTADGISGSITSTLAPEATAAGSAAGDNISKSMSTKLQAMGKNLMKSGAIVTAISVPIIKGIQAAMDAYQTQLEAETKLIEIYRARMGVSEESALATMKYASALQQQGIIGDEVLLSGAQQLATFAKYPETVDDLMPAMANLLAQQKGYNATAQDATQIANLFGKVMNGQTGALKRVGISFTDAQEQVLKYGTEQEKVAVLAEVIDQNVGNMNETMADTPLGKIAQMKNALGDLKEQLGAALAPVLAKIAQFVSEKIIPKVEKFIEWMQAHPIIAKIVVGLTALLAVGGPLLIFIGALISAIGTIIPLFSAISLPVLGIAAAIAAVIAAGVALYKHWDQIKAKAIALWNKIKSVFAAVPQWFANLFGRAWNNIKAKFAGWGSFWSGLWTKVKNKFSSLGTALGNAMTGAIKSGINKVIALVERIINKGIGLINKAIGLVNKLPGVEVGKVEKLSLPRLAKGGILTEERTVIAGEAGPEAVMPLNTFWAQMDAMANSIVNGVNTIVRGAGGGGDIILDVYLYPNGPEMQKQIVKAYDYGKKALG